MDSRVFEPASCRRVPPWLLPPGGRPNRRPGQRAQSPAPGGPPIDSHTIESGFSLDLSIVTTSGEAHLQLLKVVTNVKRIMIESKILNLSIGNLP